CIFQCFHGRTDFLLCRTSVCKHRFGLGKSCAHYRKALCIIVRLIQRLCLSDQFFQKALIRLQSQVCHCFHKIPPCIVHIFLRREFVFINVFCRIQSCHKCRPAFFQICVQIAVHRLCQREDLRQVVLIGFLKFHVLHCLDQILPGGVHSVLRHGTVSRLHSFKDILSIPERLLKILCHGIHHAVGIDIPCQFD